MEIRKKYQCAGAQAARAHAWPAKPTVTKRLYSAKFKQAMRPRTTRGSKSKVICSSTFLAFKPFFLVEFLLLFKRPE